MSNDNNHLIRHIPNGLTLARLVMTVVFLGMVLYAPGLEEKPAGFLMLTFVLFVTAGLTDIIDGKIARMYNVTSRFGRMVDPLADKILVCGAFLCFAIIGQPKLANFALPEWILDSIRWGIFSVLTIRELVVQVRRQIAEARGISFGAVWSGKIKMFIQSFGIGTVIIGWAWVSRLWGDCFTIITYAIVVWITLLSGIHSFKRPIDPKQQTKQR